MNGPREPSLPSGTNAFGIPMSTGEFHEIDVPSCQQKSVGGSIKFLSINITSMNQVARVV